MLKEKQTPDNTSYSQNFPTQNELNLQLDIGNFIISTNVMQLSLMSNDRFDEDSEKAS